MTVDHQSLVLKRVQVLKERIKLTKSRLLLVRNYLEEGYLKFTLIDLKYELNVLEKSLLKTNT